MPLDYLDYIFLYVFFYPLFTSYIWMFGAGLYFFRYEFRGARYTDPPTFKEYPLVTILVPCYNEEKNVEATIAQLGKVVYPQYEVLAINDGSTDKTGQLLDSLAQSNAFLRVLHLETNQGKAVALNTGALAAQGQYLVCIDGDALLDPNAVNWMMYHLLNSPRVGAVTGNPRVRTRSTVVGRVQVGEFSAIIGLMKRAQRIAGRLFTVSGVCSAFRKSALHWVGYWNPATLTEDIDISWKLQLNHWDVRFEPRALCWILMPETLSGLFKQRLRWAVGGGEALKTYFSRIVSWRCRRMWGIYVEYILSVIWSYSMLFVMLGWILKTFFGLFSEFPEVSWIPAWQGFLLGVTCMLQFTVSMFFDRRYDYQIFRSWLFIIWYPIAFWTLNLLVTIIAFPKAMMRGKKSRGRWYTKDRGIQEEEKYTKAPA